MRAFGVVDLSYELGLTVVPDPVQLIRRDGDARVWNGVLANLDPDNECEHGRLPTDTTPDCGCWPREESSDA